MGISRESIIIRSSGSFIPERKMTNDELSKMVDTSDEWIKSRTGIQTRHIAAEKETTSFMGAQAAEKALDNAGLKAQDIDLLIVATMTPDMLFPATACLVHAKLGMPAHAPSFDIEIACSGFVYAMEVGTRMLQAGNYKNALIIGAEKMSSIVDWEDRSTCILFGDGAGAVVLSKINEPGTGFIESALYSDGNHADILSMPAGGSAMPASQETVQYKSHFLQMNGHEVFKHAVRLMEQSIHAVTERSSIEIGAIDLVIPHQANIRIIDALTKRLGLDKSKFFCNLHKYGNTSAASIPIALDEAVTLNKLKTGDTILFTAMGGGLSWGSILLQWH